MTALEAALVAIAGQLEAAGVPHAVIGGIANAVWGEPRATLDVDVSVWVEDDAIDPLLARLAGHFVLLPRTPADFVRETRVLPLETGAGIRIDLIFGLLPFERAAIERSVIKTIAGRPIRVCTAEDLVLYKIVSDREQDRRDVIAILHRRGSDLDRAYLDPRVHELSVVLDRPDIGSSYEAWFQRPE
jgi:hypothetical protein